MSELKNEGIKCENNQLKALISFWTLYLPKTLLCSSFLLFHGLQSLPLNIWIRTFLI